MKYIVIDKNMMAVCPSKYADMFNLSIIQGAVIYENIENANNRAKYLNSIYPDSQFKGISLREALLLHINKQVEKGISTEVSKSNEYLIPNLFKGIKRDLETLEKEDLL